MLPVKNIESYSKENIISREDAINLALKIKESGNTIGLCHGCFDILHPGHIKHLESAKEFCDFLFVSITSDRFVSLTKNSNRPIFSENLRAYMLANLKVVDYVTILDSPSASELIEQIKPSFYIKGPECKSKMTSGLAAELLAIEKVGAKIVYTKDPIMSTTEIINYIQENKY